MPDTSFTVFAPTPDTTSIGPDIQLSQTTPTNPRPFALAPPVFSSQVSSSPSIQTNGFNEHTNEPPSTFSTQPLASMSPVVQPTAPSPEPDLFLGSMSCGVSISSPPSFPVNDASTLTQINADSNKLPLLSHGSPPQEPTSTLVPPTSIPDDRSPLPPFNTNIATPPSQPPPLNRHQPISLPPTPTATVFIPPSLTSSKRPTSIFGSLKSLQTSSLVQTPTEILSPLVIPSPSASRFFPSVPHLLRHDSQPSPLRAVASNAGDGDNVPKGLTLSRPDQAERADLALMEATALNFSRRCSLVKTCFSQWRKRQSDRAKWLEACKRSQAYSEKVQAERLSRVSATPPSEKQRKVVSTEPRIHPKSRVKNRPSTEYKPQTDEELAKRFEKVRKTVRSAH